jgi:hypothetical protein
LLKNWGVDFVGFFFIADDPDRPGSPAGDPHLFLLSVE